MKKIEDMNFDELVEHSSQLIHSGLLEEGGKCLKSAVYISLLNTIVWRRAMDEKEKK